MIAHSVRARLTRTDLLWLERAVVSAQGGGPMHPPSSSPATGRGDIDQWLRTPRLAEYLRADLGVPVSFELWCLLTVMDGLKRVGIEHVELADYLASVCWEFHQPGRIERIQRWDDAAYGTLAELLLMANHWPLRRAFLARMHVGNLAWWLSGMFPDRIVARASRVGAPGLSYYEAIGQSAWRQALHHLPREAESLSGLLSDGVSLYGSLRRGLSVASDAYWFPQTDTWERIWRQSADGTGSLGG